MPVGKTQIQIPAPNIQTLAVTIVGTAPLIQHRWSEKAIRMILDKQLKKAEATKREVRNPEQDYRDSFYYDSDGYIAFPALSVKQALIDSARNLENVTMSLLRGAVFVKGDGQGMLQVLVNKKPVKLSKMIPEENASIVGRDSKTPEVEMRRDLVRVGMGSADLRFRGQITAWTMDLVISFNADLLSKEQVLNLLQIAGFSSGLGEWRPSKSGDYGTFSIQNDKE